MDPMHQILLNDIATEFGSSTILSLSLNMEAKENGLTIGANLENKNNGSIVIGTPKNNIEFAENGKIYHKGNELGDYSDAPFLLVSALKEYIKTLQAAQKRAENNKEVDISINGHKVHNGYVDFNSGENFTTEDPTIYRWILQGNLGMTSG